MDAKSLILRDLIRHYVSFKDYAASPDGGFFIDHKGVTISFVDLQGALTTISPRKKEAVLYNVVYDMLQRETAEIMGIKTVTVGQYVEQAMIQVGRRYWTSTDVLPDRVAQQIVLASQRHEQEKCKREREYAAARRIGQAAAARAPRGLVAI